MTRRLGTFEVRRRPDGGAVMLMKTATGEAFDIELTPDKISRLISDLKPPESHPSEDETMQENENA